MVHNAASMYVEKANKASSRISIQTIEEVQSMRITHVNQGTPIVCILRSCSVIVSPISPDIYSLKL